MSELNPFKKLRFRTFEALTEMLVLSGLRLDQVQILHIVTGSYKSYQGNQNWSITNHCAYELVYDERDLAEGVQDQIETFLKKRAGPRPRRR